MAGLENILGLISARQRETESVIISAAERKAKDIISEGKSKAEKEYDDYMKKAERQLKQDYTNACSSVDGKMKRRQLAYKVSAIDAIIEKTLKKLDSLSDSEYFALIEKLLERKIKSGDGTLCFCEKDLKRLPEGFRKNVSVLAEKAGGTVLISEHTVNIENGFILTYGLISENCSFRAMIEAERENVRDIAARALFG